MRLRWKHVHRFDVVRPEYSLSWWMDAVPWVEITLDCRCRRARQVRLYEEGRLRRRMTTWGLTPANIRGRLSS